MHGDVYVGQSWLAHALHVSAEFAVWFTIAVILGAALGIWFVKAANKHRAEPVSIDSAITDGPVEPDSGPPFRFDPAMAMRLGLYTIDDMLIDADAEEDRNEATSAETSA